MTAANTSGARRPRPIVLVVIAVILFIIWLVRRMGGRSA